MAVVYPTGCLWTLVLWAQTGLQDPNCQPFGVLHAVTGSGGKLLSLGTQWKSASTGISVLLACFLSVLSKQESKEQHNPFRACVGGRSQTVASGWPPECEEDRLELCGVHLLG